MWLYVKDYIWYGLKTNIVFFFPMDQPSFCSMEFITLKLFQKLESFCLQQDGWNRNFLLLACRWSYQGFHTRVFSVSVASSFMPLNLLHQWFFFSFVFLFFQPVEYSLRIVKSTGLGHRHKDITPRVMRFSLIHLRLLILII